MRDLPHDRCTVFHNIYRYFHINNAFEPIASRAIASTILFNGRAIFQEERVDKGYQRTGNGTHEALRKLKAEG